MRHGPFSGTLDPETIAAYADATADITPAVRQGRAVPATLRVILVFAAQAAANGDVPPAVYEQARSGVHGEHDILLHRPLVPGETIETWSELAAVRLVAGGDPERVRRVAVRFASPAALGADLTVDVFEAGPSVYAFEATCGEATVVKHGRLELRPE